MKKEQLNKDLRNAVFLEGAIIIAAAIIYMTSIEHDGSTRDTIFLWILPPIVIWNLWKIWVVYHVKDDHIQINREGITIDAHDGSIFPKHYKLFYRWKELSAYAFSAEYIPGKTDAHWDYKLELYDTQERPLAKIDFHPYFNEELKNLDKQIASNSTLSCKPVYDIKKHGKTTFHSKDEKKTMIFSLCISLLLVWGAVAMSNILLFLLPLPIYIIIDSLVTRKDYLTIDTNGFTIDVHPGLLLKHTRMFIKHDDYRRVSYDDEKNMLEFYNKDNNIFFKCYCYNLNYSKHIRQLLKELFSKKRVTRTLLVTPKKPLKSNLQELS